MDILDFNSQINTLGFIANRLNSKQFNVALQEIT